MRMAFREGDERDANFVHVLHAGAIDGVGIRPRGAAPNKAPVAKQRHEAIVLALASGLRESTSPVTAIIIPLSAPGRAT